MTKLRLACVHGISGVAGMKWPFWLGGKVWLRPLYFGELSKIIKSGIVFGALIPQRAMEIAGVVPEHPQGDHGG
jgi:hypothetical protein